MNFTGRLEGTEKNVELKYCERCGGLFLRAPGAGIVYCGGCAVRMSGDIDSGAVISPGLERKNRGARLAAGPEREIKLEGSGQIEWLRGVATCEAWSC